jgi:branched-chain amino acid aminotransferase
MIRWLGVTDAPMRDIRDARGGTMTDYMAYFCGEWMPACQVKIDPLDRGFLVGDAVFDVFRTFNGKSFRLREHVDRLYRSLKYVRIDPGMSPKEIMRISEEAIARNEHLRAEVGDFAVWQFVTRGRGRWAHSAGPPTVGVFIRALGLSRFAHLYAEGAHGVIVRSRSFSPDALDSKVKNFSRMNFNMAELEASDVDKAGWPILTDSRGNITEGPGYNVFLVTDGVIRTADDRTVLQGVSRGMVFDLAKELGIPVVEEELQPYDLYTANEAFIASTSPCVLPVTRVDRRQIGGGIPGPVVRQLLAAWGKAVGVDIVKQALEFGAKEQPESRVGMS